MHESGKNGVNHIFIDGQNLYLSAKKAFSLKLPEFSISKLAHEISNQVDPGKAASVNFYIGMPIQRFSPKWTKIWTDKLDTARNDGVNVTTRPLRYLTETDPSVAGGVRVLSTREKGIDLRIALDAMAAARMPNCDNIIIVSRDQDFVEVVDDIKMMADFTRRDIGLWSAFPASSLMPKHNRGINGTKELKISQEMFSRCYEEIGYQADRGERPDEKSTPRLASFG